MKTLLVALSSPIHMNIASSFIATTPSVRRSISLLRYTHASTSRSVPSVNPNFYCAGNPSQNYRTLTILSAATRSPTSGNTSSQKKRSKRRPSSSSNSSSQKEDRSGSGNGSVSQRRSNSNYAKKRQNNSNAAKSNSQHQNQRQQHSRKQKVRLPEPTVLFTNNHLLLVNKPAGYHSQPNESIEMKPSQKCLLSKLKAKELGGGSSKNFLLPMHRLDQPCTGVLLLAKNSKAGTRTGNAFRKHQVKKDYLCVVEGDLDIMTKQSDIVKSKNGKTMCKLSGVLMPSKGKGGGGNSKQGKSVAFKPLLNKDDSRGRVCFLEWEHLLTVEGNRKSGRHLVRVVTGTGAKHQVRAMMAQLAKSPLCGDLRYGASEPLPDQSVALHARSLHLPTVSLGEMDMKTLRFVAPIPSTWSQFFSLKESRIPEIKY